MNLFTFTKLDQFFPLLLNVLIFMWKTRQKKIKKNLRIAWAKFVTLLYLWKVIYFEETEKDYTVPFAGTLHNLDGFWYIPHRHDIQKA